MYFFGLRWVFSFTFLKRKFKTIKIFSAIVSELEAGASTCPDYCAWSCLVVCGSVEPICKPYCDSLLGTRCWQPIDDFTDPEPEELPEPETPI